MAATQKNEKKNCHVKIDVSSIDFNCAPENGVDWLLYDAIEINVCADSFSDDDGEETCVEPCPLSKATILTLYGHLKEGGVECLHDFDIEETTDKEALINGAHSVAEELCAMHSLERGVWDHIDYC